MKKIIFFCLIVFSLLVITGCEKKLSFEERREEVLSELNFAIEEAKEEGRYKCCIEPACTMCYLGNWIWKDGSCYCDDMIVQGESEKVCPQCVKGLEEGMCKSADKSFCELSLREN